MASRQDRLHSYRFGVSRVVVALATQDPDPAHSPFRRAAGAALAGAVVTMLVLAGAAVYGVVAPAPSDGWRTGGSVIVERESGARYVYVGGVLHPVLNYASAVLVLGAGGDPVHVPRGSLAAVPRGATLGIAGAPDSLATRRDLLTGAWAVCSAGTGTPAPTIHIGRQPAGGSPIGDDGLLTLGPDGRRYLIWHGIRYGLTDLARSALAWSSETAYPVAAALLNALTAGPDLAPPAVDGRGGRSTLAGARVGDVVVETTQGGNRQYALVLATGIAPVSQLAADLLLAEPGAASRPISQADYLAAPKLSVPWQAGAAPVPATAPKLAHPLHPAEAICATGAEVAVDAPVQGAPAGDSGQDHIVVPPGRGALVEPESAPGYPTGALFLVTDQGRRFAVPTSEVLSVLGYEGVTPTRVPAALVALVPAGPPLDPVAARTPVTS